MNEPAAAEKPDFIEKIADHAGWILAVSVAVIIIVWSLYFFQFRSGLSDDTAIWGQFGDFVGGTLNSVFAFFSFMILLSSLRLQLKELRLTREELEATRKELEESAKSQKRQADHFDGEAKKKGHVEAIEYIIKAMDLRPEKFNLMIELDTPDEYDAEERIISPSHPLYPIKEVEKTHLIVRDPEDLSVIESESDRLKILDYHCDELQKLSEYRHPLLILTKERFDRVAFGLIEKTWTPELQFFGKKS